MKTISKNKCAVDSKGNLNNHGGARVGAGRKTNKLAVMARYSQEGKKLPLDVILEAMHQHYDAGRLDEAAAIAKDAAPYIHPRLNATKINSEIENPNHFVLNLPTAEELKALVRGTGT